MESTFDRSQKEIDNLPEDIRAGYGQPEMDTIEVKPNPCEHYYIRKNATTFGCRNCTNHWIDNGEFQFLDGKFTEFRTQPGTTNYSEKDTTELSHQINPNPQLPA